MGYLTYEDAVTAVFMPSARRHLHPLGLSCTFTLPRNTCLPARKQALSHHSREIVVALLPWPKPASAER